MNAVYFMSSHVERRWVVVHTPFLPPFYRRSVFGASYLSQKLVRIYLCIVHRISYWILQWIMVWMDQIKTRSVNAPRAWICTWTFAWFFSKTAPATLPPRKIQVKNLNWSASLTKAFNFSLNCELELFSHSDMIWWHSGWICQKFK